jgi:hypothetical protein
MLNQATSEAGQWDSEDKGQLLLHRKMPTHRVLLERGPLPSPIVVELSACEQARLREQMRRLRLLCPLLRLHILLLLAQRRSPTEMADL